MKDLKICLSILTFMALTSWVNAIGPINYSVNPFNTNQNTNYYYETPRSFEEFIVLEYKSDIINSETFKVYGKCGMCKKRIEGALKDTPGIEFSNWVVDTKMITVKFNPDIISLDEIKKKIVEVGHDTDKFRAQDNTYNSLPGCCQYERPKK